MNADGQKFHLLLGKADWGRCLTTDGGGAVGGVGHANPGAFRDRARLGR